MPTDWNVSAEKEWAIDQVKMERKYPITKNRSKRPSIQWVCEDRGTERFYAFNFEGATPETVSEACNGGTWRRLDFDQIDCYLAEIDAMPVSDEQIECERIERAERRAKIARRLRDSS